MKISHHSQHQFNTKINKANNIESKTVITTIRKISLSSDALDLYAHYLVKNPSLVSTINLQDISQMVAVQKEAFQSNPYSPYLLERAYELKYNL